MYSDSEIDQSDSETEVIRLTSPNLPDISKKKYEGAYKIFMDWRKNQNRTTFEEKVLIDYFIELRSKKFKSSTLLNQYSMLRATLLYNHNVDIAEYTKLKAFLRRHSNGYQPKTSLMFTSQEIDKFIKEAPDSEYLVIKVALIMGVLGACRGNELYQMRTTHFKDLGTAALATVQDNKTKMLRNFTIVSPFYEVFKKYTQLRPRKMTDPWFFLNYRNGKCTAHRIGLNKFGTMSRQIAHYLGLPKPELYTGNCFRKSSANIIVDRQGDVTSVKRFCSGLQYGIARDSTDNSVTDIKQYSIQSPSTSNSTVENWEQHENFSSPPTDKNYYREKELELEEKRLKLQERRLDLDERKIALDEQRLELEKKEREARLRIINEQQVVITAFLKNHLDTS